MCVIKTSSKFQISSIGHVYVIVFNGSNGLEMDCFLYKQWSIRERIKALCTARTLAYYYN